MNRIFYYNITYRCNLNCVFCFSTSTCSKGKNMKVSTIVNSLHNFKPDEDDLIVLNGGEPSFHPEFYNLLLALQSEYRSDIAIYSNGSILNVSKLKAKNSANTFFVIPIHGNEGMHNKITQVNGAFQHSISNIKLLNKIGYRYKIKFIINEMMILENFNIAELIYNQHLSPEEIIIARLNGTTKSKKNNVIIPTKQELVKYIQEQIKHLNGRYKIKLLDFPPCYIIGYSHQITVANTPVFYFNDINNVMDIRSYYKEIMIGSSCTDCNYFKICKKMENSYLTLSFNENVLLLERE